MNLTVDLRAEQFLNVIARAPGRLQANILAAVTRLSIEVQAAIKAGKLSGQVLHVRTGTLRRSINRLVTQSSAGVFATEGTNVRYAAIHEYGFQGDETVRGHVRKVASRSVGSGKKQTLQGIAFVREHVRRVNMPERSFLRSTLRDFEPKIRADLKAAALAALR